MTNCVLVGLPELAMAVLTATHARMATFVAAKRKLVPICVGVAENQAPYRVQTVA